MQNEILALGFVESILKLILFLYIFFVMRSFARSAQCAINKPSGKVTILFYLYSNLNGMQINVRDIILFEDDYIMVLNKPAGLMVEPDRNGYPNLLQHVRSYLKKSHPSTEEVYAQHIHRLDRPVSGVILFAKQKAVLKNLSEQFAERRVKKYYQALTKNSPAELLGVLQAWHRKEKKKAVISHVEIPFAEKISLAYTTEITDKEYCLWNIELHTGKYHQIRAQLSDVQCPIVGDQLYGSTVLYQANAIALHAGRLVFLHPITNEEQDIHVPHNFFDGV